MHNIQYLIEICSLILSLVAMLIANSTMKEKEKNRLRLLEEKIMLETLLDKHEEMVKKDINNLGIKVNNLQAKIQLIDYQVKTILKKDG